MKIIVTGATGSLGAHLVRYFSAAGHEIIASGRVHNPPQRLHAYAQYFAADISKPFELPEADLIIHSAALASDSATAHELHAANVAGTQNVCNAAKHIPMFVHVSSSSVYPILDKPLTEEMSSAANEKNLSPYGWSKLLAEKVIAEHCRSQQQFILRPRGIYGPGDKVLLPRMLQMVRNGKMVSPGRMNVQTSMTHFDNFAHAVERCIASGKTGLSIYNVADAATEILFDSIKKIQDAFHKRDVPVKRIPLFVVKALAAFGAQGLTPLFVRTISSNVVLDISKIRRELNYKPTRNFSEALPEVVQWAGRAGGLDKVRLGASWLAWE